MSMKSASDPRRIYTRNGKPLVCVGGLYFSPSKASKVNVAKTVRTEALAKSHGKARIAVTQGTITESWGEISL